MPCSSWQLTLWTYKREAHHGKMKVTPKNYILALLAYGWIPFYSSIDDLIYPVDEKLDPGSFFGSFKGEFYPRIVPIFNLIQ